MTRKPKAKESKGVWIAEVNTIDEWRPVPMDGFALKREHIPFKDNLFRRATLYIPAPTKRKKKQ